MHPKRPPVPVIVVLLLFLLVGGYYGLQVLFDESNGGLQASGTIEAVEVSVSPEMAGKVTEVLADEGDIVNVDAPLLRLDDNLLTAQRSVAAAGLDSTKGAEQTAQSALEAARAQYNLALIAARASEKDSRLMDWAVSESAFEQPTWYFTRDEQIKAAQYEIQAAQTELAAAQANLDETTTALENKEFVEAEMRLSNARVAYLVTQDVYGHSQVSGGDIKSDAAWTVQLNLPPYANGYKIRQEMARQSDNDDLIDAAKADYDAAKDELDDAQQAYDDLLDTDAADAVLTARAELSVRIERYNQVLDRLTMLQTGEFSPQVTAAQTVVDQALSAVQQAQDAVKQADANLSLVDVQMEKLTIYAPVSGTILTRNVQPGEFVQPGATVFTLANLEDITITVYVPEDRYGEISLGQQAEVNVDSFPGETFSAQVIYIADTAEYTPRNVQTVEGRSATVYAVKLKVDDPGGKLKPGMPADVKFAE
ncbi:MAG: efflux RND transporter periplasmic adaptor subunit [Anaerolineales bacterium]|jgi:HlyD family secretion protein